MRLFPLAIVVAVLVGCGTAADLSASGSSSPEATPSVAETTAGPTNTVQSFATSSAPASTVHVIPEEVFMPGLGLTPIDQITPIDGGGPRPLLAWEPVPGADRYTVLVMDEEGKPWWAWTGEGESVVLGGVDASAEIGGPQAGPGVTWVVFAHDNGGSLIAVSPARPVG